MSGERFISASQRRLRDHRGDESATTMVGIILNVHPADHPVNFSAQQTSDLRGFQHECRVLATDYIGTQPDILLPRVIIPPMRHSGVDNYEEDLPRGCTSLVDGSSFDSDFANVDYSKLDGEWCLAPSTRLLTSDLEWVPIDLLRPGRELIGFDEHLGRNARLRPSIVEARKVLKKQCVLITTTVGELICCKDHMWVVRSKYGNLGKSGVRHWVKSDQLVVGDLMCRFINPWEVDDSYESGYLAGFLDGEGSIGKKHDRSGVQFGQNPGITRDYVERLLTERGFSLSSNKNKSQFGSECLITRITGDRAALRILGSIRPLRLMQNSRGMWDGSRTYGKRTQSVEVLSIRDIGKQTVVGLQTSTRTFIAEGFLSHNCIIGFVGRKMECPFILGWWPHPYNAYDLASSGNGYDEASLKQFDTKTGKSRFIRRINGTYFMINKQGSVYLDTTESNSKVSVSSGKLTRKLVAKGGHIQVDIDDSAQLEINFNKKSHKNARLGAGSTKTSPVSDVDLPHPDQPITSTTVSARETTRTYVRGKAYKLFAKTSGLSVFCEDTSSEDDGQKGEFTVQAHDQVSLAVQPDGGTSTFLVMDDGTITAMTKDGCSVTVGNDQVLLLTKSGGQVSVIGGQISITGPSGVTVSAPATFGPLAVDGIMLGTSYVASQKILFTEWDKMLNGIRKYIDAIKTTVDTGPKYPITKALDDLIQSMVTAKAAHETAFAKYVSVQVKSQ